MSNDIVSALAKFGESLDNEAVSRDAKLKVLHVLHGISLTLNELSSSGVGRAVNKLKGEPGQLGFRAKDLIKKWKRLLNAHIAKENSSVQTLPSTVSDQPLTNADRSQSVDSPLNKRKHSPSDKPELHTIKRSSNESKRPKIGTSALSSLKAVNRGYSDCVDKRSYATTEQLPEFSSGSDMNHKLRLEDIKQKSSKKKSTSKKVVDTDFQSVDCTSGMSFADSFCVGHIKNGVSSIKKRTTLKTAYSNVVDSKSSLRFSTEILSALAEPIDRPDILISEPSCAAKSAAAMHADEAFESGDLKFKSKKIMWMPRVRKSVSTDNLSEPIASHAPQVIRLVELCLSILERHIAQVDHVGHVPYELFSQVLRGISAIQLRRIERHNPQFKGLTDDLWQRHVRRDFPDQLGRRPNLDENWAVFYQRLSLENDKRLERFKNRSTSKLKAELQSKRMTLTTEVIEPRRVQRQAIRNGVSNPRHGRSVSTRTSVTASNSHRGISSSSTTPSSKPSLLSKLRKEYSRKLF